jgi:hypothetical protein
MSGLPLETTWTSLSARLSQLPLILSGPLLRRTQPQAVTVWVALKQAMTVTLEVYNAADTNPAALLSGTRPTVPLGTNLHVVAVTALPTGASQLQSGTVYSYDLDFGNGKRLASKGVFNSDGNMSELAYAPYVLPTFALPPNDESKLHIIHGSCQKPNGEGIGALQTLDDIIAANIKDAVAANVSVAEKRPHQLFLTGDQIYADDVADALLHVLTDAGNTLLGWTETLPLVNKPPQDLKPGSRKDTVRNLGRITSDEADSHLLSLGEFYAMYLVAWSDVLLSLPDFKTVFFAEWLFEEAGNRAPRIETLRNRFEQDLSRLNEFKKALPKVRRALANIPSYMIFDDHEVTDDWYINREWQENIYRSLLGIRLLQNALSAYAVFQGWGNKPEDFKAPEPGDDLLTALANWRGKDDATAQTIRDLLSLPPRPPNDPSPKIIWDYQVDFPSIYQVIVLNTRTERGYAPGKDDGLLAPALLDSVALHRQLTQRIEGRQTNFEFTIVVSPAPVFGHPFPEEIVKPSLAFIGMKLFADYEEWSFNSVSHQSLLKELAAARQVVILSGDVHYAFTARVEYWDERQGAPEPRATFIQCVSSGLKKEDFLTWFNGTIRPQAYSYLGWSAQKVHLQKNGKQVLIRGTGPSSPALLSVPSSDVDAFLPGHEPEWRYRVTFLTDAGGGEQERKLQPGGTPSSPTSTATDVVKQHSRAFEHIRRFRFDQMFWVVGHNNLGEITIYKRGDGTPEIRHSLWFNLDPDYSPPLPTRAYTQHNSPFSVLPDSDPKPDLNRF